MLWTRLLTDRRTTLPDGETGDLLEYTRHEQDTLVLKPNRSYGGDRVLIGPSVSTAEWEATLQRAVSGEDQWVVQRLTRIPVSEFPVLSPEGAVHTEPFYTVIGLTPTKYGVSILGRASQKMVVNVAQRGGMYAMLIGEPSWRLSGPR